MITYAKILVLFFFERVKILVLISTKYMKKIENEFTNIVRN